MSETASSTELDTLPKLLRDKSRRIGDRSIAMRVKDRGIWQSYTWKDYLEKVRDLCLGMISLGLEPNDTVCIIGENKPEWFWAELAAQCAGATAVGVFTDCSAKEVKYFVAHSEAKLVVAHDQEQVDKLLEVMEELPQLKKVIYWDPKGLWGVEYESLLSMEQALEIGRRFGKENPGLFDKMIDQGRGEDIATISYTSGTTGLPKGAMMGHSLLVNLVKDWSGVDGWDKEGIEYLSFIPPAWATEQAIGITGGLVGGLTVNFPEAPETVQENIREIGPEVLFYGARLWENVNSTIQARMLDSTLLRRWIYKRCLDTALQIADFKIEKKGSTG